MAQMLVWFAILYGNLNALVVTAVLSGIWVGTPKGSQFCEALSLNVFPCRVSFVLLSLIVFGTSTVWSFKRLLDIRRRQSMKSKSSKNEET
jgi:hypothetical protein